LTDGGACQHWPTGRAVFLNTARTFVVWVGEEDHLRIISMQQGGDLAAVYTRLGKAMAILESRLEFARTDKLGYLTFCPSNLGTTMRASVHIRLPGLNRRGELGRLAAQAGLQVRGTGGEHTSTVAGVVDISNIRRMGVTERQLVTEMFKRVQEIIDAENKLEKT